MNSNYVDLRFIFDEEERQFVIGCHICEKHVTANIQNYEDVVKQIASFTMEHLLSCKQTLN